MSDLANRQNLVLLIALLLVVFVQIRLATKLPTLARLLVLTQAIFFLLGHCGRYVYWLLEKPTRVELLADERLVARGYSQVPEAMTISLIGQIVIVLAEYWILRNWAKRRVLGSSNSYEENPSWFRTGSMLLGLGWIGRIGFAIDNTAVYTAFSSFAAVGIVMLLLSMPQRRLKQPWTWIVLGASELTWVLLSTSKSALFVPIIGTLVRLAAKRQARKSGIRRIVIVTLLLSAIPLFLWVQGLKGIDTSSRIAQVQAYDSAPALRSPAALAVLERFDGASAVVDAVSRGAGNWITWGEWTKRAGLALIPKGPLLRDPLTLGQRWTVEVRAPTVGYQYLKVSLAAGPQAEGYVLDGWRGLYLQSLLYGLLCALALRLLYSSNVGLHAAALAIVFSTAFTELGVLGILANANKGLQAAVVCILIRHFVLTSLLPGKSRTFLSQV